MENTYRTPIIVQVAGKSIQWSMKHNGAIILTVLVIIGLTIRLASLSGYYYSPDDILRLTIADAPNFEAMLYRNTLDIHPVGMYFILYFITRFTDNVFFLRSITFVPGLLFIIAAYIVGKRMINTKAGIIMGFIATFGHGLVLQSLPLRQYTLALLCYSFALICLFSQDKTDRRVLWCAVFSFLSVFFHYLMIIPVFPIVLLILLEINPVADKRSLKTFVFRIALFSTIGIFMIISWFYHGHSQWTHNAPQSIHARERWLHYGYNLNPLTFTFNTAYMFSYLSFPFLNTEVLTYGTSRQTISYFGAIINIVFVFLFVLGCILLLQNRQTKMLTLMVLPLLIFIPFVYFEIYAFSPTRHSLHLIYSFLIPVAYSGSLLVQNAQILFDTKYRGIKPRLFCSTLFFGACISAFLIHKENQFYTNTYIGRMDLVVTDKSYSRGLEFIENNISSTDIVYLDHITGGYLYRDWPEFVNKHRGGFLRSLNNINNEIPQQYRALWSEVELTSGEELKLTDSIKNEEIWLISIGWRSHFIRNALEYVLTNNDSQVEVFITDHFYDGVVILKMDKETFFKLFRS